MFNNINMDQEKKETSKSAGALREENNFKFLEGK
jgi:hypothetical protein